MDTILWFLNLAWKILAIGLGWKLFKYIIKNGPGVIVDFLQAVKEIAKMGANWGLNRLFGAKRDRKPDEPEMIEAEATVK